MAHGGAGGFGRVRDGALRVLDGGAEGARVGQVVGREAGDELIGDVMSVYAPSIGVWDGSGVREGTSSFVPAEGSLRFWHSARRPARSRGRFRAGRSDVRRDEKVAGPVMCRERVCLLPAAMAWRARDEAREACMAKKGGGAQQQQRKAKRKKGKARRLVGLLNR